LQLAGITETPLLEAQLLVGYVFTQPREWVAAHPETQLNDANLLSLNKNLKLLLDGCPLAYITGTREFFGRTFSIKPGVLVPRPETELLVEEAIHWVKLHPEIRNAADVGCGSGCIAVSLAAECPTMRVYASDVNPIAARLTYENAVIHKVEDRILCVVADLLSFPRIRFDLICANLPYIPSGSLVDLPVTRYEPRLALDGGVDGLRLMKTLLSQAKNCLSPAGCLLLEIESSQGTSAPKLARRYFPQSKINLVEDLAGHPRLIAIQNYLDVTQ
jgi:release factor glutamine methyltransferase